ncbi:MULTISPECIES: hypothetical protein [unclassified Microcoleus]
MEASANLAAVGNAGIGWVVNFRRSRTAIAFLLILDSSQLSTIGYRQSSSLLPVSRFEI